MLNVCCIDRNIAIMSNRRGFLAKLTVAAATLAAAPVIAFSNVFKSEDSSKTKKDMSIIGKVKPLGFTWETADPFLFCVHHEDKYPKGNEEMGPDSSNFSGRHLGDDFIIKDGFRMYHGKTVPGFPGHPHRGFETITVVREGVVDHADSTGASGRYGNGDVQWMTAGKGVQHSEMFPLVHKDKENPMELFQIWLNLPKANKMVEPHFKMLWRDMIPNENHVDKNGKKTTVEIISGKLKETVSASTPPDSWAADTDNEVAIWNILMEAGAEYTIPKASAGVNRNIYFYEGDELTLAGEIIPKYSSVTVKPDEDIVCVSGKDPVSMLILQGKPINEEVIQYGPFVMNTKAEIQQAFDDYHKTGYGGWPWPKYDQVHDRNATRFAKHADGRLETKEL
ncbi:MAG: redox-sensitive bicupin YhaK (pirin superfamily) [Saprospiraceae bacterium]|jgi:redox-sensitive bicupin YhaK (pirin superfamily)